MSEAMEEIKIESVVDDDIDTKATILKHEEQSIIRGVRSGLVVVVVVFVFVFRQDENPTITRASNEPKRIGLRQRRGRGLIGRRWETMG